MKILQRYGVLASKGFSQNLQYAASHLINTVASAVFGLIYIYLWKSVTPVEGFSDYSPLTMIHYVSLNQATLWLTQFGSRIRVRIAESVRSGNIAAELMRPMDYFSYRAAFEVGSQAYSLIFRGLPIGLMLSAVGFYIPKSPSTWLWTFVSLGLACYIGVVMGYMVGVSSFWTTEIRTLSWVLLALEYGLGGASMPLEVLPGPVETLARLSPFPCLTFFPARIYLELSGPGQPGEEREHGCLGDPLRTRKRTSALLRTWPSQFQTCISLTSFQSDARGCGEA